MDEKIKFLLDKILGNKDEPLKVEYIANKLKQYLVKEQEMNLFIEIVEQYDRDDIDEALKRSSNTYNIRLRKILLKEFAYLLTAVILDIAIFKYVKIDALDLNMKTLFAITFILIYIIFRSGKIKKIVKDKSNEEYEENLSLSFRKEIDDRLNK